MTRLAQIVSNLLHNSAKYTHRGGHVRLTVGREDAGAVVSVKDDGIGIPPAMIDRVFEMFIQVDRTLEKTTGGLGIGLSLVKGLLDMHGGTIQAKSDQGNIEMSFSYIWCFFSRSIFLFLSINLFYLLIYLFIFLLSYSRFKKENKLSPATVRCLNFSAIQLFCSFTFSIEISGKIICSFTPKV